MNQSDAALTTYIFNLRNEREGPTVLWVEPLGDRIDVSGKALLEVVTTNQLDGPIEIAVSEQAITVSAWVKSIAEISEGGRRRILWSLPP